MSKISILTFHYSNNVAAMLQAYGLVKALKNEGHDVEVIDYRPLTIRNAIGCRLPRHPWRRIQAILFRRRIRQFREIYLPLSKTYLTMNELKNDPPKTDYVVCGSDQVWNITSPVRGFDPTFFLDFLPTPGPQRVSYAASFGNGFDLGDNHKRICSLLLQFDHISVREVNSQKMVHDLIARPATHVLDPSFLADYQSITPPPIIKPPYILTYCFRKNDLAAQAVKQLQSINKIPVISVKTAFSQSKILTPGPLQWLSLMRHASFVCTDSFHGTCFSLINQKSFLTFPLEGGNSRLKDVLETAGLSSRFIENADQLKKAIDSNINYTTVSAKIEKMRKQSLLFLRKSIK